MFTGMPEGIVYNREHVRVTRQGLLKLVQQSHDMNSLRIALQVLILVLLPCTAAQDLERTA